MNGWVGWALMTMGCWGVYGVLLHNGAVSMGDPVNGRLKAFLFVGLAYFLVAVLAPLGLLWARGADLSFPAAGFGWSLVAGIVGAIGALGVLLAFGAKGPPTVVMTIIFAGAPIINTLVSTWKAGLWGEIRWPFVLGIALAAAGGGLASLYKPEARPTPPTTEAR